MFEISGQYFVLSLTSSNEKMEASVRKAVFTPLALLVLLTGCNLLDTKTKPCGGTRHTVTTTAILTPSSSYYKLSTPLTDSAILSKSCLATFSLEYGFSAKATQAKAFNSNRDPRTMPLTDLFNGNLFHVDRSTISFSADKDYLPGYPRYTDTSIWDFYVTMSDHGDYEGMSKTGHGIFFIETFLNSANPDSSMWVSGTIQYWGK